MDVLHEMVRLLVSDLDRGCLVLGGQMEDLQVVGEHGIHHVSQTITNRVLTERTAFLCRDTLEDASLQEATSISAHAIRSILCARDRSIGGDSAQIREVVDIARRAADSPVTVLVLGASGTGKEVLARSIHRRGEAEARTT